MIHERGNIKWTAMMLPEHLSRIKQLQQEENQSPRALEEWELEELQQTIDSALQLHAFVTLHVWENQQIVQWTGTIQRVNHTELLFETLTHTKRIALQHIQSAQLEVEVND